MGHALRAVAGRYRDEANSVTFFMDGDSYFETDTLKKLLPSFASNPKLGAVTTNEIAFVDSKSVLYKDWFNLKFGINALEVWCSKNSAMAGVCT